MNNNRNRNLADNLVYMATGIDENGDTHIFVSSVLRRAESRHREVMPQLTDVKADWLDE